MRIRSKLVALMAVPLAVLALAAGFGLSSQNQLVGSADDSAALIQRSAAVDNAVMALSAERLVRVGVGSASFDDTSAATDVSLASLDRQLRTDESANEEVRALLDQSRLIEDPAQAQAILASAIDVLLDVPTGVASDYPDASTAGAAFVNRLATEALHLREAAWISFLGLQQAEAAATAAAGGADATGGAQLAQARLGVASQFAAARTAVASTTELASRTDSTFLLAVAQSDAEATLAETETGAFAALAGAPVELAPEQIQAVLGQYREAWVEAIEVERDALANLVAGEREEASNLRSLFALLLLVGALILCGALLVIYRSFTRPLETLLAKARLIATDKLPDLVVELRDTDRDVGGDLPVAEPITVRTSDEIAELADAFNDVQATAYDLATEQALGRRNVSDMFVNLGRRNQQLLQRILAQLTHLERDEEDPDKLSELFELDHIVTRMRRNAESLLALAGDHTARRWAQPIEIESTIRAAFGEVEGYDRIEVVNLHPGMVTGSAVADITHLLAELLENAIRFSDPETMVEVSGRPSEAGYIITVADLGIGMTPDELVEHNRHISEPPPLDRVPTRFLGLYVVGRLAERHGIDVTLSARDPKGIRAEVLVPSSLLMTKRDAPEPELVPAIEAEVAEAEAEVVEDPAAEDEVVEDPAAEDEVVEDAATEEEAEEPIVEEEPPEGLLPVRQRGEAFADGGESTESTPRRRSSDEPSEDDDGKETSADEFSSMMSALSGGVHRAEQSADHRESR